MAVKNKWFITGIGTGVGKTFVSTVLAEYLQADYWKPVQSGDLESSDSLFVEQFVSYPVVIHPERYALTTPVSPHQAAAMESVEIRLADFKLPVTDNHLIVEGAGGLFVPLNNKDCMVDLIVRLGLATVLVIQDYLGCINHSLLSLELLKQRHIPIAAVVFNGNFNPWTLSLLRDKVPVAVPVLELPRLEISNPEQIQKLAKRIAIG